MFPVQDGTWVQAFVRSEKGPGRCRSKCSTNISRPSLPHGTSKVWFPMYLKRKTGRLIVRGGCVFWLLGGGK